MSRKIDDIVLLRGVAILLVLLCHVHNPLIHWPSPFLDFIFTYVRGESGVDLFFAISGFVIARNLYPKLTASSDTRSFVYISLAFWTRRAWRILPSAWLWLAIILFLTIFFNQSGAFLSVKAASSGAIAAVFQVHNYWVSKCFRHYDCGATFFYWTLSLEEQFYLLLPIVIFLCRRWSTYLFLLLIVFQLFTPNRSVAMQAFRTDTLLLGVLLALWSSKPSYFYFESLVLAKSRWLRLILILGLFAVLVGDASLSKGQLEPMRYGLIAIDVVLIVLISSYDKNYLMVPGLVGKVLIWLGTRSCSIYLTHIPAFFLTQEIWYRISPKGTEFNASYTIPFLLTAMVLVYLLGETNYRFLELPSRRKGAEISTRVLRKHEVNIRFD